MSDIVDLLIAPERFPVARKFSIKQAISLVLDGRLGEYDTRAEDSGLPRVAKPVFGEGPSEVRLLSALLANFQGMPIALRELEGLASSPDEHADIVTVAAVMAATGHATAGRYEDAAVLVQRQLPLATEPMHEAVLALHSGYRLGELARYEEAVRWTTRALELAIERPRSEKWRTIRAVADANLLTYLGALGQFKGDRRKLFSTAALADLDAALAAGLRSYLRQHFDAQFADPYTRTISFRADDPVDSPLSRALIRAQALAYRFGVDEAHELIGKYRLLSAVGREEVEPRAAIVMLVRARDHVGLHRAVGLYRAVGPLAPIAQAGEYLSVVEWPSPQLKAILIAIKDSAPLLSTSAAARAADRIIESLELWAGWTVGAGRVEREALGAISALAPLLPDDVHARAAEVLLRLAQLPPDGYLHQSMGRALRSLRWESVPAAKRRSWLAYLERSLSEKTDHLFVGHEIAGSLASIESEMVGRVLRAAFDRDPSLFLAATLIENGFELDANSRRTALELAVAATSSAREASKRGSYSIGGLVQAGSLLAHLAAELEDPDALNVAVELLYDASASLDDRTAVALALSQEHPQVALRGLPPASRIELPFDEPAAFQAAILQFGVTYGLIAKTEAIDRLMTLANSRDRASRIYTARTLPLLRGVVPAQLGAAIGLTLASDNDVQVLATAAQVLPRLTAPGLHRAIRQRTLAFLQAPGDLLPAAALAGWAAARAEGTVIPNEVRAQAHRLLTHISMRVRDAATRFVAADMEP